MTVRDIKLACTADDWDEMPRDGRPEVAFVGRSNVGKSSLLNMLLGEKNLAPTSKKPGKTRRFYFYLINKEFYIVDLPGYGYARTSKADRERWAKFIETYLEKRRPLAAVCHLVDSRHPPTDIDREVIRFMKSEPVPYIIVLTKADKLSGNERRRKVDELEKYLTDEFAVEVPVVLTSAAKRQGGGELWTWLERLAV